MKKRLNNPIILCSLCLAIACFFYGCKKDNSTQPVAQSPTLAPPKSLGKAQSLQKAISSTRGPQQSSYGFKKDPFKPLISPPEATAAKASSPEKVKLVDALPIQSYEASLFAVTGIITGLKENKALVIDPTGKGYVVKTGMLIGNSGGRISKITNSAIEVTEQLSDGKKRVKTRKIVLPLAKKSKENTR